MTGLSERWNEDRGDYEFRIFYEEDHVLDVPEKIDGLPWILVIRRNKSEYVHWSAHRKEEYARQQAEWWERNNV